MFMDKFSVLTYDVVARGSLLNDAKMIEEGLTRLSNSRLSHNAKRRAKARVFNYGMIHQNPKLLTLVKKY